jgi:hypothetical protein
MWELKVLRMQARIGTGIEGPRSAGGTQTSRECEWVFTRDSKVPRVQARIKGLESTSKNPRKSQRSQECEHK